MSVTKRILGDYNIINKDSILGTSSNVTVTTNWLYIDGNLFVGGNATEIHKSDSYVTDTLMTLNYGETSAGVAPPGYSGIEIDRGTLANVAFRWNENFHYWELTNDGTTYQQITSGNAAAGISNVYADSSPTLSANLNLYGHGIFDPFTNVGIETGTVSSGGTGVYAVNNYGTEEVISKKLALIYTTLL